MPGASAAVAISNSMAPIVNSKKSILYFIGTPFWPFISVRAHCATAKPHLPYRPGAKTFHPAPPG